MLCKFKLPSLVLIITSILAITGVLSTYIHKDFVKYESFVDKPKPPAWPLNNMKKSGGKQNELDKPKPPNWPLNSMKNSGGKQNKVYKLDGQKPPNLLLNSMKNSGGKQNKVYKLDGQKPPNWPLNSMKNSGGKQNKVYKLDPSNILKKSPSSQSINSGFNKQYNRRQSQSKLYKIVAVSENELDEQCIDRQI
jgi:hypothetical protein